MSSVNNSIVGVIPSDEDMSFDLTETSFNLKQWHQGKEESLNTLLKRNITWIQARVRQRLSTKLRLKVESIDIVQDAAIQFLRYGPRFLISDKEAFRVFISRIVENVVRDKNDWFTARRRNMAMEKPLPSDTVLHLDPVREADRTPSQSAQEHEQEAWIRLGMELLDPEDREILVLRQWDRLPFVEIGRRLNVTKEGAWMRHKRAVIRLSEKIGRLRRREFEKL